MVHLLLQPDLNQFNCLKADRGIAHIHDYLPSKPPASSSGSVAMCASTTLPDYQSRMMYNIRM